MNDFTPIRWQQRYQHLRDALEVFRRVLSEQNGTESMKLALVQSFEICCELSWKTIQDYLRDVLGISTAGPKEVIKSAFQAGVVRDGHEWLQSIDDRNLSVYTYDKGIMELITAKARDVYPELFTELVDYLATKYEK